jgi:hypothetical protein
MWTTLACPAASPSTSIGEQEGVHAVRRISISCSIACSLLILGAVTPALAQDEVAAQDSEAKPTPRRSTVLHVAPVEAPGDQELRLVAVVDAAWTEAALVVRYRGAGSTGEYQESPFERSSAGGYYAAIPADSMQRPGIEYYIAGQLASGSETLHFASAMKPHQVVVAPTQSVRWAQKERQRLGGYVSSVSVDVRGHNFGNRYGNRDQYIRGDLEWTHRLLLPGLYSISLGYAMIEGYTPTSTLDTAESEQRGARFGYGGVLLRLQRSIWLEGSATIGVDRGGFIAGAGAELTLGRPWRSNISMGAEYLQEMGPTLWIRLQWDTAPPFIMGAAIVKTDLPAAVLEHGSYIVYDVAYPLSPRVQVRGSVSFGSRDGPGNFGGGLGTAFAF